MSLGQFLDKDLVDNLAIFIASRQWKSAKDLAKAIRNFRLNDDEGTFVSSGWPIGKVESEDHFKLCCKKANEKGKFYNIATGLLKKAGFPSYVYGDGWCVPRGCPEHIALEKVIDIKEKKYDIDVEDNGWPILAGMHGENGDLSYVWDCDKDCVVGVIDQYDDYPHALLEGDCAYLKNNNIPFRVIDVRELKKVRL